MYSVRTRICPLVPGADLRGFQGSMAPSAELHRGCLEPSEQEGFWNSLNQMVPGTLGTRGFLEPSEPQEKKETYLIGQVFFVPKN